MNKFFNSVRTDTCKGAETIPYTAARTRKRIYLSKQTLSCLLIALLNTRVAEGVDSELSWQNKILSNSPQKSALNSNSRGEGHSTEELPTARNRELVSRSATSRECKSINLNFEKAEDGRPLAGGTFVGNEWFFKSGIKITARSHEGPQDIYPMIFDSGDVVLNGLDNKAISFQLGSPNIACGGVGVGKGGDIGQAGENCGFLSNVLIPSRRAGNPTSEVSSLSGILVFEFDEETAVNAISLLNIMDTGSYIQIYQVDGTITDMALSSVGQNGFQTLQLNLDGVTQLSVFLNSFAAVVDLDLLVCMPTPTMD